MIKRGLINNENTIMRRKAKRELLENENLQQDFLKVQHHFFPDIFKMLNRVNDPRHPSYIEYSSKTILFLRILSGLYSVKSMRKMTEEFNVKTCVENVSAIVGEELEELPYWETVNDYLKMLNPEELEKVTWDLVNRLIRMRSFEDNRIKGKYWQIIIDGTGWVSFDYRHCEHCLSRTYKNDDGNEGKTVYYHYVLEAKLVLANNIVVSIGTEFVENESEDVEKQDCESRAFERLAEKLKKRFKRLPICITGDSLYATKTVFNICAENNWEYIIRFKEGSIPTVAREFNSIKEFDESCSRKVERDGIIEKYSYVNNIDYGEYQLNAVEGIFEDNGEIKNFLFLTSFVITAKNHEMLLATGRNRWLIENQGFNTQKHHGFCIQHNFSHDYNAMKNHYYLIQIAHMISQLLENGLKILKECKISKEHFHKLLLRAFQTYMITEADLEAARQQIHVAFI